MQKNKINQKRAEYNVQLAPFKYLKPSVRTESYFFLSLLVLQLLLLVFTKSWNSLFVVFSAVFASVFSEAIDLRFQEKDRFTWTICVIKGILIGLFLPSSFPVIPVFFVSFCVFLVNRYILGGFANSWINPVAVTVAVCYIIGLKFFPEVSVTLSDLQSRNPALALIQNGTFPVNQEDLKITAFLNRKIFSAFKVSIPDGYVSLLWDSHSSIPAFRFNFLTIVSSIALLSFDIISPIIPTCFIFVYSLLVRFVSPFFYQGPLFQGDVILALFTSGTLFCAFFLLQWHGTVPLTNRGKVFYGIFSGIIAFLIAGAGTSPSGMVFTVLILNIVALLIENVENHYSSKFAVDVLKKRVQAVREGENA